MQMKINDFRLNSDYATLKNDTYNNTISVTITAGTVVDLNVYDHVIASTTMSIGTRNAGLRARGNSSRNSTWVIGTTIYSLISTNNQGEMSIWCTLRRTNPGILQLLITSETVPGAPLVTILETQTITFKFATFLSPFNT